MEKTYKTSEDIRKNGINMKIDPLLDEGMGFWRSVWKFRSKCRNEFYGQFKNPEINFCNQFKNPEINFYGQFEKQGIHISEEQRKQMNYRLSAVREECQSEKSGKEMKNVILDCFKDIASSVLVGIAADFFNTASGMALTGIDMYRSNRQTTKRKSPFCSKRKNNSFFHR